MGCKRGLDGEVVSMVETPSPEVVAILQDAFGIASVGQTGCEYELDASKTTQEEKESAKALGSSLLYGELLPQGVSKALLPDRMGNQQLGGGHGRILELGMGSGKVALQVFAECRGVRSVMGIEIVQTRYAIGEAALHRLAAARPNQFRLVSHRPGERILLEEDSGRSIEFRCGCMFGLEDEYFSDSDAIFLAVNFPFHMFPQLCTKLATAKDGCTLFTYHPLYGIWWTDAPCPFFQREVNLPETDMFATSWSPQGFRFYVYACDRNQPPKDPSEIMDGTFSEWEIIQDTETKKCYFYNHDSEASQWDVPAEVGGWVTYWSEEHSAHYYAHVPTSRAQWEVPPCITKLTSHAAAS